MVYNGLKCWDANGKPLVAALTARDNNIFLQVNVADASYPVTIDPIVANGNPGNANQTMESNQANAQLGY